MEKISKKYKDNIPTGIKKRDFKSVFMNTPNQLIVTKEIYQKHKFNGGILGYLYFKEKVPQAMYKWILYTDPPRDFYTMDVVEYLNKQFVKQHFQFYDFKTRDNLCTTPDSNVYRNSVDITFVDESCKDATAHFVSKNYNNLLASDYGLIDVWAPTTVEYTNTDMRYFNKVPVWQKSMNKRHYDQGNQGFRTTKERASLNTPLSGYGSDFHKLVAEKEELYRVQSTRGNTDKY
ncbi:MAG: hypothetical protein ACRCZI_04650 [Cetobacterium sp.]